MRRWQSLFRKTGLFRTLPVAMTRAITINAPVQTVWQWLVQIGDDVLAAPWEERLGANGVVMEGRLRLPSFRPTHEMALAELIERDACVRRPLGESRKLDIVLADGLGSERSFLMEEFLEGDVSGEGM